MTTITEKLDGWWFSDEFENEFIFCLSNGTITDSAWLHGTGKGYVFMNPHGESTDARDALEALNAMDDASPDWCDDDTRSDLLAINGETEDAEISYLKIDDSND